MSKKKKALWAWLTAFAMVLSVLSGHAGPYRAHAAEQAIPDTLELGKSYSGTLTTGSPYTVDTTYAEGDKFMVEMTIVSGAAIYKQVALQSNALGTDGNYWNGWKDIYSESGIANGTLFAKTITAMAPANESDKLKVQFAKTLMEGATEGDGKLAVSNLKITKISGPQYLAQTINEPVSEVMEDQGWGFQKQFSITDSIEVDKIIAVYGSSISGKICYNGADGWMEEEFSGSEVWELTDVPSRNIQYKNFQLQTYSGTGDIVLRKLIFAEAGADYSAELLPDEPEVTPEPGEPTATPEPGEPTVTPEPGEPTVTPEPDEPITEPLSRTIELGETYSGTIGQNWQNKITVNDPEFAAGTEYVIEFTIAAGAVNYQQVAVQTDCVENYGWFNGGHNISTGIPDNTKYSVKIEVTKGTGFSFWLTGSNPVDETIEGDGILAISGLKVVANRKVVDATARYEVVEFNKPATEVLDLVSGDWGSNYQKSFAFPAGLKVDEVVAVWKSSLSFSGIFGGNVDNEWTTLCEGSSSSGQSTWKVSGLSEKNLGAEPSINVQIWWPSTGLESVTLQKLIFAEKGADYSKELGNGSGGTTGGSGNGFIENLYPDPTPTTAPAEEKPDEENPDKKQVKAGDKLSYDYAEYADVMDRIEVVFTSSGYFNGSLGLSIDGAWGQTDGESGGGTTTWVYDNISGREANGYFEVQIWYVSEGVTVTLDRVTVYDKNGNVVGGETGSEPVEPDDGSEEPDDGKEEPDDGRDEPDESGERETQVIRREIPGEGATKVTNEVKPNKTLDANNEGGKMYQIPLDQFAESGAIKKFAVTITFDQPSVLGWTGGGGGIGFSTDKEWQTADFEHGFIDGAKNTVRYEFEVPEGVTVTMNTAADPNDLSTGSIFQVGWWWGSTPSITVDKIEIEQEKPNTKVIEITVSKEPVFLTEEPGSHSMQLSELVGDTSEIDSLVLHVAATGKFKGAVYAKLADGELPLMAEGLTKIADIEMDEYGYSDVAIDELAGLLEGELVLEVTEIEEGATVVVDGIRLLNLDGEDLTDEPEWNPDEVEPEEPDDTEDPGDTDETDETEEPDETEKPDNTGETDDTKDTDLPKTGLADSGYFYLIGLAIMFAGAMLAVRRRKEA